MKLSVGLLGANGFVGSATRDAIEARGHEVRMVKAPRLPLGLNQPYESQANRHEVVSPLAEAMVGCDVIVNAAGLAHPTSPPTAELYGANALMPLVAAIAADQAGCSRFIHVSSAAVQGEGVLDETGRLEPLTPYGRSKALGEKWLGNFDSSFVTIVRPTSVHGPGRAVTSAVRRIASSPVAFVRAPGTLPTQQTHVSTVANFIAKLAEEVQRQPVHLTPDENFTTSSFLHTISGKEPKRVPSWIVSACLAAIAKTEPVFPALIPLRRRVQVMIDGQRRVPGVEAVQSVRDKEVWEQIRVGNTDIRSVIFGVTSGISLPGFYGGFLSHLGDQGWKVLVSSNSDGNPIGFSASEGAAYIEIEASRNPSLLQDARTLHQIIKMLRSQRPSVAVWGSPKIGLLGPMASKLLGVPSIYVIHGLRLDTANGIQQKLLLIFERIASAAADRVVAVGNELADRIVDLRIAKRTKVTVLANGSANGVAPGETHPRPTERVPRAGFAGRITPDKGLNELARAWPYVVAKLPLAELYIAGAIDDHLESERLAAKLDELPGIRLMGHQNDLSEFYKDIDVLILPSLREGLPNVVLEAAAAGVPAVVTDSTGTSEPVIDGMTGLIVPTGNIVEMSNAITTYLADLDRCIDDGVRAREHVLQKYDRSRLWREWSQFISGVVSDG